MKMLIDGWLFRVRRDNDRRFEFEFAVRLCLLHLVVTGRGGDWGQFLPLFKISDRKDVVYDRCRR